MNANIHWDKTTSGPANEGSEPRRSLWKTPLLITLFVLTMTSLGNQFVDGWNWPIRAFVVVSILIFTVSFIYQLITRNREALAYRAAVGIAFVASFVLVWGSFVQMADMNPAIAMHFGVPIVGIIGAFIARLRPMGLSRVMFVMAITQGLVWMAVQILLINGKPESTLWTAPEWRRLVGSTVIILMFVTSALLFRKAGREATR